MRRRRLLIQNIITEAREKEIQASTNQNISRQMLNDAKTNAQKIVLNARQEAEEKKMYILQDARQEIDNLNQHAQISIAREREASKEDIRRSIADAAITTAAAILKKEINPKTHAELIDDCIEEIE